MKITYVYKILVLLLISINLLFGDFYVSPNGNDTNSGTLSDPFKTIQHAIDKLESGTIFLRESRYHEKLKIDNKSGITFRCFDSKKAIIDGSEKVTSNWIRYDGSIYKTTLNEDIWQVFVNNRMHTIARWPNIGNPTDDVVASGGNPNPDFPPSGCFYDKHNWAHIGMQSQINPADDLKGAHIFIDDDRIGDISGVDLTGAIAVGKIQKSNHISCEIVTQHDGGSDFFCTTDYFLLRDGKDVNTGYDDERVFWLEDKLGFLDAPGEWFYDEDTKELYLWCEDGGDPSNYEIRVRNIDIVLNMKNCENINFYDINFFAGRIFTEQGGFRYFEDCTFSYPSISKRSLGDRDCPEGNDLNGGHDDTWYNCVFEYSEGCPVTFHSLGTMRWKIENCLFHHILWAEGRQGAVYGRKSEDDIFFRNTIHTMGKGNGIKPGKADNVELNKIYNIFYHSDASAIQVPPYQQPGIRVHHNWTYDVASANVIRFDGDENDETGDAHQSGTLDHNIVFRGNRGFRIKGMKHYIYNNTALECLPRNDIVVSIVKGGNDSTFTYNNAGGTISGGSNSWQRIPGDDRNNWNGIDTTLNEDTRVDGVPTQKLKTQLMDPDNFDFRPRPGSDLIDAGLVIPNITDGYIGDAPDVGAYEYGDHHYWIPGRLIEKASSPVPPDNAKNVRINADLMWLKARNSTSFDIYFGDNKDNLKKSATNIVGNNIFKPGFLKTGKTYYWRVATDTESGKVQGDIWTFTVRERDTLSFATVDDAWISHGTTENHGLDDNMYLVKDEKTAYLKFDLFGLSNYQIESSYLSLKLSPEEIQSEYNTTLFTVAENSWTDSTINGNNAPQMDNQIAVIENIKRNREHKFQLNDFIQNNGEYSFGLNTNAESPGIKWFSKESMYNPKIHVVVSGGPTNIDQHENKPEKFQLFQNYPNPFNSSTIIKYKINNEEHVKLSVYNLLGELIDTIINKKHNPGQYQVNWRTENFASGVYFYRLESKSFSKTMKCLLVK